MPTSITQFNEKTQLVEDIYIDHIGPVQSPGKSVTSKDERKAQLVHLFKQGTNSNKITNLREHKDGSFSAECLKYNPKQGNYIRNGVWTLTMSTRQPTPRQKPEDYNG